MTSFKSLIVNYREGIFQPTSLSLLYYDYSGVIFDTVEIFLPYGDELLYAKSETVDKTYLEALDSYIGT